MEVPLESAFHRWLFIKLRTFTNHGWLKGDLKGCIYNVTKSDWFDSACFQQWFVEIFMKTEAEKPGKYVLLGDNLASHFNLEVIKIAEQNDVYFAMLPPNATHLLQPLDVCVFSSMKESCGGKFCKNGKERLQQREVSTNSFSRLF